MNPDFDRARRCVEHYRKIGLCPLPSRMDVKGPMLPTFAEHYGDTPVPEPVYRDWRTTNVQIITGLKSPTPLKLLVVDIDGEGTYDTWESICKANGYEPRGAWRARTGSGGHHFYFSLPSSLSECPSGPIYGIWDTWGESGRGRWLKHREIRILADRALVIAPPSIHVDTGERYRFAGPDNPNRYGVPAEAPAWLVDFPRLVTPRCHAEPPRPAEPRRAYSGGNGKTYTREEVLDAIGDRKLALAKSWGLKTASDTPNANGWVKCWVPGREDHRSSSPSGSFHFADGTLQDRKDDTTVSLFDLGARIGGYKSWQDCCNSLGAEHVGRRDAFKYTYG